MFMYQTSSNPHPPENQLTFPNPFPFKFYVQVILRTSHRTNTWDSISFQTGPSINQSSTGFKNPAIPDLCHDTHPLSSLLLCLTAGFSRMNPLQVWPESAIDLIPSYRLLILVPSSAIWILKNCWKILLIWSVWEL